MSEQQAVELLARAATIVTQADCARALGLRRWSKRDVWRLRRDAALHRADQLISANRRALK